MKTRAALMIVCAGSLVAPGALADEPPPQAPDPVSFDRNSPSVVVFGETPCNIYGEIFGAGLGGWDIGGPGPILHIFELFYGMMSPPDNNDGHSNGEFDPNLQCVVYFSGDENAKGLPGTAYRHQAVRLQAAGDRFVTNGPATLSPSASFNTGTPATIGPAAWAGPVNLLSVNQTSYNAIPSIPPIAYNLYTPPLAAHVMDDVDALELTPFDFNGDQMLDTPIYFSFDAASALGPFSAADIWFAPPGLFAYAIYAQSFQLGLQPGNDEVDALAVFDLAGLGVIDPGLDYALFSLAPGSISLAGPDGVFGTPDDYSAADIFVTDFNGFFTVFLAANSIGMDFNDNVDAIDVELYNGPLSVEIWDDVPPEYWEAFWDADLTTQGVPIGDPLYGVPDGRVTAADIQFYVNAYNLTHE